MKILLDQLKNWGCDIDGALNRLLQDEELLLQCMACVAVDESFVLLEEALGKHDVKVAFDMAHTLKGIAGNTGLTPLLRQLERLVEPLRIGVSEGLEGELQGLLTLRDELGAILTRHGITPFSDF